MQISSILLIVFFLMAAPTTATLKEEIFGGSFFARLAKELLPVVMWGYEVAERALEVAPTTTTTTTLPPSTAPPRRYNCSMLSLYVNATIPNASAPFVLLEFAHRFRNDVPNTKLQAEFIFPIMPDMALTGLVAITPRSTVTAVVKEKGEAQREYQAAVQRGDGAFMSEYAQQDLIKLSVGNLLPNETIEVKTTVAWRLHSGPSANGSTWMFELPLAYIIPFNNNGSSSATDVLASQPRTSQVPYTWGVEVNVLDPAAKVESVTYTGDVSTDQRRVKIPAVQSTEYQPNRLAQFLISFHSQQSVIGPNVLVSNILLPAPYSNSTPGNDRGLLITFPASILGSTNPIPNNKLEYVFIIDRSGSMNGESIKVAREALAAALLLLPEGSYFDVISFGSDDQSMFGASVIASPANVQKAWNDVQTFQADLGGTNIQKPLSRIFSRLSLHAPEIRNVFLLTDGQVSDEAGVINLIKNNNAANRVFTFGIGDGVSPYIIVEGARAGRGTYYFLASGSKHSYLAEALNDTLARSTEMAYSISNMRVHTANSAGEKLWTRSDAEVVYTSRAVALLAIANATRTDLLCGSQPAFISGDVASVPHKLTTRSTFSIAVGAHACLSPAAAPAELLKLAAKSILLEMENVLKYTSSLQTAAVNMSVKYQVLSSVTALLAIERRETQVNLTSSSESIPTSELEADASSPLAAGGPLGSTASYFYSGAAGVNLFLTGCLLLLLFLM